MGLGVGDEGHGLMKGLTLDVDEKVDGIAREVSVRPDPVVGFDEKTGGSRRIIWIGQDGVIVVRARL
jgi:hypothetical protein